MDRADMGLSEPGRTPADQWWAINGQVILDLLKRAEQGESAEFDTLEAELAACQEREGRYEKALEDITEVLPGMEPEGSPVKRAAASRGPLSSPRRPRHGRATTMATVHAMRKLARGQGEGEPPAERLVGQCELCGHAHAWPDLRSRCLRCGAMECNGGACECEGRAES